MRKLKPSQKLLMFLYAAGIMLFCHHFIFRPIILDWGAPLAIRELTLPGDAITEGGRHTRAVLIDATPEQLWPWVIQLGQDRGGFYSYQWLENIFRAGMKNSYAIKPEFQFPRQPGDTVWLAAKNRYHGGGYQILAEIVPFRSFVMVGGEDYARLQNGRKAMASWAFYLQAANAKQTWLIARSSGGDTGLANKALRYFFFEVPHFIMERKMLLTMEKLAERQRLTSLPEEPIANP